VAVQARLPLPPAAPAGVAPTGAPLAEVAPEAVAPDGPAEKPRDERPDEPQAER